MPIYFLKKLRLIEKLCSESYEKLNRSTQIRTGYQNLYLQESLTGSACWVENWSQDHGASIQKKEDKLEQTTKSVADVYEQCGLL